MIGEMVDEFVPWEVTQQINLMNAIFSQCIDLQLKKLQKERCCGCKIDHPNQRQHDCIMVSEEEGWITYGLEAVEHIFEKEILLKQFREAIRIMKLTPHEHVFQHYQKLKSNHVSAIELIMDVKTKLTEYRDILGYLYYWQDEHC